jgi:hypothetical protein
MGFSGVFWHIFLQSDLRLAILAPGSRLNLPYSAQARLQQLLQMQNLHERLWKTRRSILWKRIYQEESVGNRLGIVAFVYVLLLPVPTVALFFSLLRFLSLLKLLVLVCLLTVAVYSLTTWYNSSTVNRH